MQRPMPTMNTPNALCVMCSVCVVFVFALVVAGVWWCRSRGGALLAVAGVPVCRRRTHSPALLDAKLLRQPVDGRVKDRRQREREADAQRAQEVLHRPKACVCV